MSLFQTTAPAATYIDVILPLALSKLYTYVVPDEFLPGIQKGIRVEVQFGKNKLYAALVSKVHKKKPAYNAKPILSVLDEAPIVSDAQLEFWIWLADYYCCSQGEVMHAAFPAGLKMASETKILLSSAFEEDYSSLDDKEYLVAEALSMQHELSIGDIQKILNQKTVYPVINSLIDKQVILLKEELKEKYKPRMISFVRLKEPYKSDPETLKSAFEAIGTRATKQLNSLMAFIQLSRVQKIVKKSELLEAAEATSSVLKELESKGILEEYKLEVSRLESYQEDHTTTFELSAVQLKALLEVQEGLKTKNVCLVHGITGSGKTELYIELISDILTQDKQVLYLLPEIALTAQIIDRLKKVFGDKIAVYHSRLNNNERVEIWHQVMEGKPIILGPRSALLLPYGHLGLIVVDEEHDPSYKQQDPAPRYNGRDAAVYLAKLHRAKVVLGTATPSVESYANATAGKYGLVEMNSRFGGIQLPEMELVNASEETRKKKMKSHFTSRLIEELEAAYERGEQSILFQNRRGYAPTVRCDTCNWTAMCVHCDVSLTYHKYSNNLRCHYCGYQISNPAACPACGDSHLSISGFGTEKIEDELALFLPKPRIGRMDWDTVKGKHGHQKIIRKFEEKKIEILVGTQMVTKGLDFDNVSLVGVLSADQLLYFPDFRAAERAYQLLTQVAGRAGRKNKRGLVLIQAFNVAHPIFAEVLAGDFLSFFQRELEERKRFRYPPFYRLISITLKHTKRPVADEGAKHYAIFLKEKLGNRVLGPADPGIPRVRNYYLKTILIKLERNKDILATAKSRIEEAGIYLKGLKGMSGVRVKVDVDPY